MNIEEFYERCAQLLATEYISRPAPGPIERLRHDGTIRNTHKTRWNDRDPGNGRFPGRGLVRHFGSAVFVNLHDPPLWGTFKSSDEALAAIARALDQRGD